MIALKQYDTKFGKICCLPNDIHFNEPLSHGKLYQEDLFAEILPLFDKPKKYVMIDVGAHIGCHSIVYSKSIPNCEIIAIEPQSILSDILNKNIRDNDISNCTVYNNAVGHTIMQTTLSKDIYQHGYPRNIEYGISSPFYYDAVTLGLSGENVNMVTIDSLQLQQCDYIKMMVGGAELLVIVGALHTIQNFHPIVLFEENGSNLSDDMVLSMKLRFYDTPRSVLTRLGYNITNIGHFICLAVYPGT